MNWALHRWQPGRMMSAMKQLSLLLLAGMLFLSPTVEAATTGTAGNDPNPQAKKLAETVSMVTGVAISPLMGVGAVGAYQWWTAPREKRADLPWFANPFFWVPALLLVGACFLKDTAGMALPAVLKKPFDVTETFEHKISGLVATGAFVPIIVTICCTSPATPPRPARRSVRWVLPPSPCQTGFTIFCWRRWRWRLFSSSSSPQTPSTF